MKLVWLILAVAAGLAVVCVARVVSIVRFLRQDPYDPDLWLTKEEKAESRRRRRGTSYAERFYTCKVGVN